MAKTTEAAKRATTTTAAAARAATDSLDYRALGQAFERYWQLQRRWNELRERDPQSGELAARGELRRAVDAAHAEVRRPVDALVDQAQAEEKARREAAEAAQAAAGGAGPTT